MDLYISGQIKTAIILILLLIAFGLWFAPNVTKDAVGHVVKQAGPGIAELGKGLIHGIGKLMGIS